MNHLLNKYLVRQNELFQKLVPIEMLPRTFFQELISRPTPAAKEMQRQPL